MDYDKKMSSTKASPCFSDNGFRKNLICEIYVFIMIFILIIVNSGMSDVSANENTTMSLSRLELLKQELINVSEGTKSVILSPDGSRAYSINLEGMSVYEIDRATRKILRKLNFVPHPGKGFNYDKDVWIDSYQEKPVEACFTHDARFLWISLHNADGIVVWDLQNNDTYIEGKAFKEAWLHERVIESPSDSNSNIQNNTENFDRRKVRLLWIKTGKTPKIVTSSTDGKYLFVSNWHSNTVSVLDIASSDKKDWMKLRDLKTGRIPRGLAVSPDSNYLYVAQMGGSEINVVDLITFQKVKTINVGRNPRHIVVAGDFMYVSLNMLAKLVKIDLTADTLVKSAKTGRTPRTIALTKDKTIIFVVSYRGDALQAFSTEDLKFLGSWKSSVHPVGVDVYQDSDLLEVWVANYSSGTIRIFTFKKLPG